jgi:hypothetical protein
LIKRDMRPVNDLDRMGSVMLNDSPQVRGCDVCAHKKAHEQTANAAFLFLLYVRSGPGTVLQFSAYRTLWSVSARSAGTTS